MDCICFQNYWSCRCGFTVYITAVLDDLFNVKRDDDDDNGRCRAVLSQRLFFVLHPRFLSFRRSLMARSQLKTDRRQLTTGRNDVIDVPPKTLTIRDSGQRPNIKDSIQKESRHQPTFWSTKTKTLGVMDWRTMHQMHLCFMIQSRNKF